jgi:hypothetical protein
MRNAVNSPRPVILVQCLTCQHRGFVSERELVRFGIKPAPPLLSSSSACAVGNAAAAA